MTDAKHPLRVFLCHASSDKPVVVRLYERLIGDGIDAWLDKEKLVPGQDWQIEIPKAVKNSDIVIVCLSSQSITKEGFVQKEIKIALDAADEKPDETIFLIPARLEDCQVPERIKKYQWVDLFVDDGYEQLFKALQLRAANLGIAIERKRASSKTQTKDKHVGKNETINPQNTFKLWGRENEITRIMNVLRDPKGLPFISISGLGGIGKTALARAVASECQQENLFSQIIWETAQYEIVSGSDIVSSKPSFFTLRSLVVNILTKLGLPNISQESGTDNLLIELMNKLSDIKALIIVDNLETAYNYKEIVSKLATTLISNTSRFILTSRPLLSEFTELYSVSLSGLDENECVLFLRDEGKKRAVNAVTQAEEKHLKAISRAIGGTPLAGKLVISQLVYLPMESVLENLKKAKGDMELVYTFIYKKSWELLSPEARKVLLCMPTFPAPVTYPTIEYVSTVRGERLNSALYELVRMSLLDTNDSVTRAKRRYSIHQLTRNFVQTELINQWS